MALQSKHRYRCQDSLPDEMKTCFLSRLGEGLFLAFLRYTDCPVERELAPRNSILNQNQKIMPYKYTVLSEWLILAAARQGNMPCGALKEYGIYGVYCRKSFGSILQ